MAFSLTSPRSVANLRQALRGGLYAAREQIVELDKVDVSSVERTAYPAIHEAVLDYLSSRGYTYLTREPGFFVIGETSIEGTTRRADGFICDPLAGEPVYALEVGIGPPSKFWSDYNKCVAEWSATGLAGAFILLLEVPTPAEESVAWLDSAELRTGMSPDFSIHPLILPLTSEFTPEMRQSVTAMEYLLDHAEHLVFPVVTLSDRKLSEVKRWTNNVIVPSLERGHRLLNNVFASEVGYESVELDDALAGAKLIIVQAEELPQLTADHWEKIATLNAVLVFIGDWITKSGWEIAPWLDRLPVVIEGENHRKGGWGYTESARRMFGRDIVSRSIENLDLRALNDLKYGVTGFVKCSTAVDDAEVNLVVLDEDGQEYPFVVSSQKLRSVFLASGVGGWGGQWYRKYPEGYQIFWEQVIRFAESGV